MWLATDDPNYRIECSSIQKVEIRPLGGIELPTFMESIIKDLENSQRKIAGRFKIAHFTFYKLPIIYEKVGKYPV